MDEEKKTEWVYKTSKQHATLPQKSLNNKTLTPLNKYPLEHVSFNVCRRPQIFPVKSMSLATPFISNI